MNAERECEAEFGAERGAGLLASLNVSLHTMSQPMTALVCMLEYGAGLTDLEEVKGVLADGLEQCERLMGTVRAMQTQVLRATGDWERNGRDRCLAMDI